MNDQSPRYASMRDYLSLIRRQRLVVILVAVTFGLTGLGLSLAQSPTYVASASLAFRDVAQDLPLIGGSSALPEEAPSERAARNAQVISGERIARHAQRILKSELPVSALSSAITAQVGLQTNLVTVTARWSDPQLAAEIANAFAKAAVRSAEQEEQDRLRTAITGLQRRLKRQDITTLPAQFVLQQISQLRAVKEIARAAEITSPAEVPGSQASPNPVRNTILGALVGLAFGLVAAFLRDSLDRRLRTSHEIHEELGMPILGQIGSTALGSTGLIGREGVNPTLTDLESFRILRSNLGFLKGERPTRTVLVTSSLAQEGKSTVAAALASASAATGARTLLVDCDLRRPVLAERLGLHPSPGLTDYLAGDAKPGEILQVRAVSPLENLSPGARLARTGAASNSDDPEDQKKVGFSLVCIAAGQPPTTGSSEMLASDRARGFLEQVSRVYDLVVIDSSPMLATADPGELLPLVDAVLICVRLSSTTRDQTSALRHALSLLPDRPTGIVVTGVKARGGQYGYYGYEYAS